MHLIPQSGFGMFVFAACYLFACELLHRFLLWNRRRSGATVFPPILRIRMLTWLLILLWIVFLWHLVGGKEKIHYMGELWLLLFWFVLTVFMWPGTTIVTVGGIIQNRFGPLRKRTVPWSEVVRVDYSWKDRARQGLGLILSIEGLTTTVFGVGGNRLVHSAHNEGMLEFDRILRNHLPPAVFPEAALPQQTLV